MTFDTIIIWVKNLVKNLRIREFWKLLCWIFELLRIYRSDTGVCPYSRQSEIVCNFFSKSH